MNWYWIGAFVSAALLTPALLKLKERRKETLYVATLAWVLVVFGWPVFWLAVISLGIRNAEEK